MYIIPLAWLYVAVMMAVAEATSSQGTLLGALITFMLYGALPIGIMLYLMGTPLRRKKRLREEAALDAQNTADMQNAAADSNAPNASGHATGAADIAAPQSGVAPVRKID
jgi:hypothetical protein